MEVPLLNGVSVQQLYNYPETGSKEQKLYFLVCSSLKIENNLFVELSDLKYKIKNVVLAGSKEIKAGDCIIAKKFAYKYEKDVEITITDFEKIGEISVGFVEGLKEYKNDGFVDCYFIYRKKNNNFKGFNDEVLEFQIDKIESKINLEDSKVYLFQRLEKINGQKVKYLGNISFISEHLGENISIIYIIRVK